MSATENAGYRYSVTCCFSENAVAEGLPEAWLDWLRYGHIQDVIDGGAICGEIIELNAGTNAERLFRIDYTFPSAEAFQNYETQYAPALREEGRVKFPPEMGLSYNRADGAISFRME